MGCEARKTPAVGEVFFLDFFLYRTIRELIDSVNTMASARGSSAGGDFDDVLCHALTTIRRFRFDRVRQSQPLIVRDIADLQVVTVRRGRVITLVGCDVNIVDEIREDLSHGVRLGSRISRAV